MSTDQIDMKQVRTIATVVGMFESIDGPGAIMDVVQALVDDDSQQRVAIASGLGVPLARDFWPDGYAPDALGWSTNFFRRDGNASALDGFQVLVGGQSKKILCVSSIPFASVIDAENWLTSDAGKRFKSNAAVCVITTTTAGGVLRR